MDDIICHHYLFEYIRNSTSFLLNIIDLPMLLSSNSMPRDICLLFSHIVIAYPTTQLFVFKVQILNWSHYFYIGNCKVKTILLLSLYKERSQC